MAIDPKEVNPIFENFSNLIGTIRKNVFRPTSAANRQQALNKGIGERVVDKKFAEQIYGDKDVFMSKYKEFEKLYYEELSDTKNVRS